MGVGAGRRGRGAAGRGCVLKARRNVEAVRTLLWRGRRGRVSRGRGTRASPWSQAGGTASQEAELLSVA